MSTAKKWNSSYMIPTSSDYCNRIVEASFSPSKSSGNPMVTVECEVVTPQEVEVGGEQVLVAGVKTTNYFPTTVLDPKTQTVDEEKTEKARVRFSDFLVKVEVSSALDEKEISTDVDWDNFDTKPLLGKLILTQMESELDEKRATPTSAEIEAAKKLGKRPEGKVMKNPMTGKVMINYWPRIREIFGLAPNQDGTQVPY